ncbi:membrane bound O-acyl transferase MBOAT family protein [Solidesulfovibrio carbinoliphilus subsp. oakridgensis]|uniref:Membrane bound O-acyl transferase MBOAT family protein n=1 Tax=Solidesulfovibrio carbinoliphilus subsp. oakridgensis TaxID=694327 RepID=G7Q8Q7_9BACT|nr:MBOAT family O-acyltransferase [Solidesulfovibrio carbinoliphilus]EHJ49144.1 membrane bound O-acyl transferase MBOAT family protein [Solidesulfovibrio carbinoliphilus subsp. oakridgensis]
MIPDSPLFLYYFLPLTLALFFLSPVRARGAVLLVASLAYFFLADAAGLPVLLAAAVGNYGLGRWIGRADGAARTWATALGVAANIGLLAFYKYGGLAAPLGISFFSFQAVAYLVDVKRRVLPAEVSLPRLTLALAFFPKITAGPIARFGPLLPALVRPRPTLANFRDGAWRFAVGLAKKTLVAGALGPLADAAFTRGPGLDTGTAWLGLAAYSAQIYYDFSGYTDMALGLGLLCGIRLPENFNHPYVATSVRDFWRRWHISLSTWFRDYLYIPLGGGRVSPWRVRANLLVVFALCGVWHGATLNFLAWGLWHGLFLAVERTALGGRLDRLPAAFRHAYLLLAVMLGWVLFRATDAALALGYGKALFSFSFDGFTYTLATEVTRQRLAALAAAVLFAMPLGGLWNRAAALFGDAAGTVTGWCRTAALAGLLAASAMALAAGAYTPFIYARF